MAAPTSSQSCLICSETVTDAQYRRELTCSFAACPAKENTYHEDCITKYLRKLRLSVDQLIGYQCPAVLCNGKACSGRISGSHRRQPVNQKKKQKRVEAAAAAAAAPKVKSVVPAKVPKDLKLGVSAAIAAMRPLNGEGGFIPVNMKHVSSAAAVPATKVKIMVPAPGSGPAARLRGGAGLGVDNNNSPMAPESVVQQRIIPGWTAPDKISKEDRTTTMKAMALQSEAKAAAGRGMVRPQAAPPQPPNVQCSSRYAAAAAGHHATAVTATATRGTFSAKLNRHNADLLREYGTYHYQGDSSDDCFASQSSDNNYLKEELDSASVDDDKSSSTPSNFYGAEDSPSMLSSNTPESSFSFYFNNQNKIRNQAQVDGADAAIAMDSGIKTKLKEKGNDDIEEYYENYGNDDYEGEEEEAQEQEQEHLLGIKNRRGFPEDPPHPALRLPSPFLSRECDQIHQDKEEILLQSCQEVLRNIKLLPTSPAAIVVDAVDGAEDGKDCCTEVVLNEEEDEDPVVYYDQLYPTEDNRFAVLDMYGNNFFYMEDVYGEVPEVEGFDDGSGVITYYVLLRESKLRAIQGLAAAAAQEAMVPSQQEAMSTTSAALGRRAGEAGTAVVMNDLNNGAFIPVDSGHDHQSGVLQLNSIAIAATGAVCQNVELKGEEDDDDKMVVSSVQQQQVQRRQQQQSNTGTRTDTNGVWDDEDNKSNQSEQSNQSDLDDLLALCLARKPAAAEAVAADPRITASASTATFAATATAQEGNCPPSELQSNLDSRINPDCKVM